MSEHANRHLEVGDRVRLSYGSRAKEGTVVRLSVQQFLVAFDDGARQWHEIDDLDAPGNLCLVRSDSQPPVKVDDVDPLGALANLRAYLLQRTDHQFGMPSDPHELVRLTIAIHASLTDPDLPASRQMTEKV